MMWEAGVADAALTPPMGVEMAGYGFYLNRRCTDVRDDLRCRALALRCGETTVAIATCDLIGLDRESVRRIREEVAQTVDLPATHVAVTCTHTHSGPSTFYLRGWGDRDATYLAIVERTVASTISRAVEHLEPVTLRYGTGRLDGFAYNRTAAPGGLGGPGDGGATSDKPVDPTLGVLSVDRGEWDSIAVVASFGCHPVTNPVENTRISRDYPGAAADVVEAALPGTRFLFLQGACGDINPVRAHTGQLEASGLEMGGATLQTFALAEPLDEGLAVRAETIDLPLRPYTEEEIRAAYEPALQALSENPEDARARFTVEWGKAELARLDEVRPMTMPCEIQVFRVGGLTLVFHPTELFARFALALREASDGPLWNIGYANDILGYVPDRAEYETDGYAAVMVPKILGFLPFRENVGDVLVTGAIDLLRRMSDDT